MYIQWDDDNVLCLLDQRTSASSLKEQFMSRHVASLWQSIVIESQPLFALTPWCSLLSRETVNTDVIVFGLTCNLTIYHTQDERANHHTTDVVYHKHIYVLVVYNLSDYICLIFSQAGNQNFSLANVYHQICNWHAVTKGSCVNEQPYWILEIQHVNENRDIIAYHWNNYWSDFIRNWTIHVAN